jgi:Lon protease-like protein
MSTNQIRYQLDSLPKRIPIFPLSGALLLPRTQLPLNIFEPRYLAMIDDSLAGHRHIGMTQPLPDSESGIKSPPVYGIGCLGRITSFAEVEDGRMLIILTGITRFSILKEMKVTTPYRQVQAGYSTFADDLQLGCGEEIVNRKALLSTLKVFVATQKLKTDWNEIHAASNELLVNYFSSLAPFAVAEKQALLEAPSLGARAELLLALTEMSLRGSTGGAGPRLQ